MTKRIFEPLNLGRGAILPNRIVKSAMSERLADPDRAPSEGLVTLYRRWAQGGTGLLITGNVMVDGDHLGEVGNVVVEDEQHLTALKAWAASTGDTPLWMQINHPGRQTPANVVREPVAPSAVRLAAAGPAFAVPRALTEAEIEDIIARFATTAAVAKAAGFGGVQLHGAHGYLVSQFLSPLSNRREDKWGGSIDNRMRFLRETLSAMRSAVGPNFPVGLKLNSADFQKGGFTAEESMAVIEGLQGVDMLEISGGTYESAAMWDLAPRRESTRRREAYFLDYAESVRARCTVPLLVTGGFRSANGMNEALESGIDLVGMARPLAVEPDLPAQLADGTVQAARPLNLSTFSKKLDTVIQGGWYQAQINRMAQGLEPDPGLTRISGIVRYLLPRKQWAPAVEAEQRAAA